jgi:uncharacterized membrane protein
VNIKKFTLIIIFCLFGSSCTIYTEKQSESLSRSVYASKDSFDAARLDLTDGYLQEASRIVKPPKKRIEIKSVYHNKPNIEVVSSDSKSNPIPKSKQRVLIVPEKYKNDTVIIVNSVEYEQLLKDKEVLKQLQNDLNNLSILKTEVDNELIKQEQYKNKMIQDLNIMQKKLVEKDLAILKRNIIIFFLLLSIASGIYLRMKGIL